jgi:apolipoprotein N-acyltransferase
MERQGVAGWFVDSVPLDDRITFYSRYGDWIDKLPAIAVCLIAIMAITEKRTGRKKQ